MSAEADVMRGRLVKYVEFKGRAEDGGNVLHLHRAVQQTQGTSGY